MLVALPPVPQARLAAAVAGSCSPPQLTMAAAGEAGNPACASWPSSSEVAAPKVHVATRVHASARVCRSSAADVAGLRGRVRRGAVGWHTAARGDPTPVHWSVRAHLPAASAHPAQRKQPVLTAWYTATHCSAHRSAPHSQVSLRRLSAARPAVRRQHPSWRLPPCQCHRQIAEAAGRRGLQSGDRWLSLATSLQCCMCWMWGAISQ